MSLRRVARASAPCWMYVLDTSCAAIEQFCWSIEDTRGFMMHYIVSVGPLDAAWSMIVVFRTFDMYCG